METLVAFCWTIAVGCIAVAIIATLYGRTYTKRFQRFVRQEIQNAPRRRY